jgi:hypothetical protein
MPDGTYIFSFRANNNQTLYFTATERNPVIRYQDVNFDGRQDLVIYTAMGASNAFCEFFVYNGGQYHAVTHQGSDMGLANFELLPSSRLVVSRAANGAAGALHEYCLYQWKGSELRLVRQAISDYRTVGQHQGDVMTEATYMNELHVRVLDGQTQKVLWEEFVTLGDDSWWGREEEVFMNGFVENMDVLQESFKEILG